MNSKDIYGSVHYIHTQKHTLHSIASSHSTVLPPSYLTSAIQVAQLQPEPSDNEDKLTYKDVLFPRDKSAVASSLNIHNSMVPQMVIPGALLEERASERLQLSI